MAVLRRACDVGIDDVAPATEVDLTSQPAGDTSCDGHAPVVWVPGSGPACFPQQVAGHRSGDNAEDNDQRWPVGLACWTAVLARAVCAHAKTSPGVG